MQYIFQAYTELQSWDYFTMYSEILMLLTTINYSHNYFYWQFHTSGFYFNKNASVCLYLNIYCLHFADQVSGPS